MEKFNSLKSIPSYLPLQNIDTDMIIPKQFLKTIKRTGLGKSLFFELRYDENNKPIKNFILNQDPYNKSEILLADKNFGCGSSREHAAWSLLDFGIKVVISPSFADIFYNNCFKNGILPIELSADKIKKLSEFSNSKEEIEVDLANQVVKYNNDKLYNFEIEDFRKHCLIEGLDDIALTLEKSKKINDFLINQKSKMPWLF